MSSPTPRPRLTWRLRHRSVSLGHPTSLMALLNLTPDSCSDGGRDESPAAAVARGLALLDQGADLLDLGAESTRPNAAPLTPAEEQQRLLPVLRDLRRARPDALLSIDTFHACTARAALDLGADIINDVSGLTWDPAMRPTLATASPSPGIVLMHARGTPSTWSALPPLEPSRIPSLVRDELAGRLTDALTAGIPAETIVLDPGFGFGKRGVENYVLLAHLADLHSLGRPLLLGLSRKRFLATDGDTAPSLGEPSNFTRSIADQARSESRLHATIAANVAGLLAGAHLLRIHDVPAARTAADIADRTLSALAPSPAAASSGRPHP